ncbi:MAG: type II toxin-antitoxin system RelE/ParE family toxin [Flavobacteriales bacterium]|nr:type II toxin-antitoxin system RelE/ParE family toxin [Flavobacteriales bacterium]
MAILQYWAEHNGSTRYSEKLDGLFRKALLVIANHPLLGRPTTDPEVRVKSIGDHLLFYAHSSSAIHVLSVWHTKRDPARRPY